MLRKYTDRGSGGGGGAAGPASCPLSLRLPTLIEFLTVSKWEDGSARILGTITLMFDVGVFKAAVNDRDADISAFVSGATLTDVLLAVDQGLEGNTLDWRQRPKGPGRSARKSS